MMVVAMKRGGNAGDHRSQRAVDISSSPNILLHLSDISLSVTDCLDTLGAHSVPLRSTQASSSIQHARAAPFPQLGVRFSEIHRSQRHSALSDQGSSRQRRYTLVP